jgi:hypothetical protein
MAEEGYYRVLLDKQWTLHDLYEFPHAYSQNYAFVYCFDSHLRARDRARINRALEEYPWLGGYSYVNIYTVLQNQVPARDRPRIASINKSSPGWLDLFLNADVALSVARSVATLAASSAVALIAYKEIKNSLSEITSRRKNNELESARLTHKQAELVTDMCIEMARFLGFKGLRELHQYTGSPEVTLKLMLAHYRRISTLVKYVHEGKAALPSDNPERLR